MKLLKRKLDDLLPTLSDSPIPSPDANAPSPSPDSDFELPSNEKPKRTTLESKQLSENNGFDFSFINSTFMGNSQFSEINLQVKFFSLFFFSFFLVFFSSIFSLLLYFYKIFSRLQSQKVFTCEIFFF